LRTLQVANHRHRHTNAINQAQVQAQRAVGRRWPCTLDLIALADQPHGQRIPVGLALAALTAASEASTTQAITPTTSRGMPTSINVATSTTAP
jgi:hypothetical protein